jgi:hypothetical protein
MLKMNWVRQYKDDQGRIIWHKEHTLVHLLSGKLVDPWFDFILSKYGPPAFYAIQVGLLYLWFFVYPSDSIQAVVLPVLVNIFLYGFLMLVDTLPRNWMRNRYIVPTYIIMLTMQCYILVYVNISIDDDWADQQVTLFSYSIDEENTLPIELNALSLYSSSAIAFILIMFWSMVGLIWSGKGAAYMRYAAVAVDAYLPPKQVSTPLLMINNSNGNQTTVDSKQG